MQDFTVSTSSRQEISDINMQVNEIISKSGIREGICLVYTPHSTCSIIINENYDSDIMLDFIDAISILVPKGKWRHDKVDGNVDAHIKSAIIGPSESVIIKDGKLKLGKWQNICLADFDGPRKRKVYVKITEG